VDLGVSGRTCVVTGASKGIGLACARAFLSEGAHVAIASRSEANLAAARGELGSVITVAADLADADAARAMVERVEADLGAIDILVTSAGAARRTPADELTPGAWRAAMDAKYFTYLNVIDPVIKHMAARGRGVIVNIIGNGGKVASPIHLPGGAANAALMLATVGLANAYAAKGVRILGINPGLTKTSRVVEGMQAADGSLHALQEGFWAKHGLQCGFCTPGMIMAASDLLARNADPSDEEIRHAIEGNICRCTGYHNIVAAIREAASTMRAGAAAPTPASVNA